MESTNRFFSRSLKDVKLPIPLQSLFDEGSILQFYTNDEFIERKSFDGVISLVGEVQGKKIALLWNDFKIQGGSFGKENSKRICEFVSFLKDQSIPLVFALNTIGVRIMEGRTIFPYAFSILPVLSAYKEKNLFITCTIGKCLGLGALLFELGDLRLSLEKETALNLSGPEIIKLFFGEKFDFDKLASTEIHLKKTRLIHEVFFTKEEMIGGIRDFFTFSLKEKFNNSLAFRDEETEVELTEKQKELKNKFIDLMKSVLGDLNFTHVFELFKSMKTSVKTYIIYTKKGSYGLFINPPGLPNMIDSHSIKHYRDALNVFKKLKLPVVSIVNTSGADPRDELNIIHEINQITTDIIRYPYPKVGIIHERSYGGASILIFPEIFGGEKTIAIKNSKMNIMDPSLIKKLLEKTPRLLQEWEENHLKECPDLSDLVAIQCVGKMINESELFLEIQHFLDKKRSGIDREDIIASSFPLKWGNSFYQMETVDTDEGEDHAIS